MCQCNRSVKEAVDVMVKERNEYNNSGQPDPWNVPAALARQLGVRQDETTQRGRRTGDDKQRQRSAKPS